MDFLDIFKGGLQAAIDIEAEKERAAIENKSRAADNDRALIGDSGTLFPVGTVPLFGSQVSPLLVAGGVVILALIVFLVARR